MAEDEADQVWLDRSRELNADPAVYVARMAEEQGDRAERLAAAKKEPPRVLRYVQSRVTGKVRIVSMTAAESRKASAAQKARGVRRSPSGAERTEVEAGEAEGRRSGPWVAGIIGGYA